MAEVGKKKEMAEGVGEEERKRRDGGKHRWSRRKRRLRGLVKRRRSKEGRGDVGEKKEKAKRKMTRKGRSYLLKET